MGIIAHNPDFRKTYFLEKRDAPGQIRKERAGFVTQGDSAAGGHQRRNAASVDATDDGAIVLRQAGVYPIEIYSDDRIASFLAYSGASRHPIPIHSAT